MIERAAPLGAHHLWRNVYDFSSSAYTHIDGYDLRDAELTADAAVAGWYAGRRLRVHRGLPRMPRPGNLLNIGCFLNLATTDPDGTVTFSGFSPLDRIPLYWSEDLRACFILPYIRTTTCIYRPTPREDRLARVWAKGRPASCAKLASDIAAPAMPDVAPVLAISYRSDKFTHGKTLEYIHHVENGVLCYFARPHSAPRAIMVRGGKLRLTKDGLEG